MACGKLEHGKRDDGSSAQVCFACGRPKDDTTAEPFRPSRHTGDRTYWAGLTNSAHSCWAGPGVPEWHAGSLNTASATMEAQPKCALRVVARRMTLQRSRLAHQGILDIGRIGRG